MTVAAAIADWQLIPTARFAAGEQDAIFTLFGTLKDEPETERLRTMGYEILNYHRAFKNTLLGLRLFQADVLVLAEASTELPSIEGEYLLGTGESPPDVDSNLRAWLALDDFLLDGNGRQIFQSYLITDYLQEVTFGLQSDELVIDGYPLWYLWRYSLDPASSDFQTLVDQANDQANDSLNAEYAADAAVLSLQELDAKYTEEYVNERFEELFDEILSPEVLEPLLPESEALSEQIRESGGVNPAVYQALTTVMGYAALFRRAKAEISELFTDFVVSLPCGTDPSLRTPGGYRVGGELRLPPEAVPGPECEPGAAGGASGGGSSSGNAGNSGAANGGGRGRTGGDGGASSSADGGDGGDGQSSKNDGGRTGGDGGNSGAGGSAADEVGSSSASSNGCSCRIRSKNSELPIWPAAILLALGLAFRRERRGGVGS